jgi:rod shape-determining protein MreB and related proteins
VRDGVIADYEVTEGMLRYFIERIRNGLERRPEVMLSVPVGVTSVESRAVREAAVQAGARVAYLIPEPLAAALGAGLPVDTPTGNMIVNIGGGTAEAAVISMYGIVVSSSVRVAGIKLDEAIAAYVRRKYNLVIGEQTAEQAKIAIGSAIELEETLTMEVRGRDQVAGLPRTISLNSSEVTEALSEPLDTIVENVKTVLESTPPELAADIIDRGMVMAGGSAQLRNFDRFLTKETGIPCHVAENPMLCTALGAARGLEKLSMLRRALANT